MNQTMRIHVNPRYLPLLLQMASCVLAPGAVALWTIHVRTGNEAARRLTVAETASRWKLPQATPAPAVKPDKEVADAEAPHDPFKALIAEKKLFGEGEVKLDVHAIVAETALVNDHWLKIGEEKGGIRLLELFSNKAVVEFEGKEREVTLWSPLPGTEGEPPSSFRGPSRDASGRSGSRIASASGASGRSSLRASGSGSEESYAERQEKSRHELRRKRDEMRRNARSGGDTAVGF